MDFSSIIELTLYELSAALTDRRLNADVRYYGRGIELYLTNQLDTLKQHITHEHVTDVRLRTLLELRLATRCRVDVGEWKARCYEIAESNSELSGEAYFVLAAAAESLNDDIEALQYWRLAKHTLEKNFSFKKAIKAEHNALATQSRIDPSSRLLIEYQSIVTKAETLGEPVVQANAVLNLSREYQLIGALQVALRYAHRAVELTQKHQRCSLQYFLSIAHRCHIYLDLKQMAPAFLDFEELQTSTFPEAIECAKVLGKQLHKPLYVKISTTGYAPITASWAERNAKLKADMSTGPIAIYTLLEQKLIDALATGPKDRFDLIQALFASTGDIFSLENRLKQILFRIRKKAPGLIELKDGKYCFTEHDPIMRDFFSS